MSSRLSMRLERLLGLRRLRLGLRRLLPVLGRLPLVLAPRQVRRLCCNDFGRLPKFAQCGRVSSRVKSLAAERRPGSSSE
jgi:hypothetical protein